jgi:hypothetical protein
MTFRALNRLSLILLTLIAYSISNAALGQGSVLVLSDQEAWLFVDDLDSILIQKNKPRKISLEYGQHYFRLDGLLGDQRTRIIDVSDAKQVILQFEFNDQSNKIQTNTTEKPGKILIADLNLSLGGGLNALAAEDLSQYQSYTELHYAFAKGDVVELNSKFLNKRGSFFIQLEKYPEGKSVYLKQNLLSLDGHQISIQETSIYTLRIGTTALFDKQVQMSISRTPMEPKYNSFSTTVDEVVEMEAVQVLPLTQTYLNSTSHETWKGGTNEAVFQINIDPSISQWYYIVAASRDAEDIENTMKTYSLAKQVSSALGKIDPSTAIISSATNGIIDIISAPPGADYCDVLLLDPPNSSLFLNDQNFASIPEGTRKNIVSAKVPVTCCTGRPYFLGLENNDLSHGVGIVFEVVGIKEGKVLKSIEIE